MTQAVKNRFKSFAWRAGIMVAVTLVNYGVANLSGFGLSPELTVLAGLILGEISKYLNREVEVIGKKEKTK